MTGLSIITKWWLCVVIVIGLLQAKDTFEWIVLVALLWMIVILYEIEDEIKQKEKS